MEDTWLAGLAGYARRLHERAGDGHHVVSPLGAWLLVALCAPLAGDGAREELESVLGTEARDAARTADHLLGDPHPAVAAAAGAWARPHAATPAWRAWHAALAASVDRGDIPSAPELDVWASNRTSGLVDRFPAEVGPETAVLLATALATRVSWEQPFSVVGASELRAGSTWARALSRVLRSPVGDPRHRSLLLDAEGIGMVAVHLARAREGLLVVSAIAADPAVPAGEVLALADGLAAAEARRPGALAGVSLFDLALGDGPVWTITEEAVETAAASGREERIVAVLPAWAAATSVDLRDERLGLPATARAVARATGLEGLGYAAVQRTVARYSAVGFEAAAVTAFATAVAFVTRRPGLRRSATLRFRHPFAVAAAACAGRHGGARASGEAWHGVPVFSAWVAEPVDAAHDVRP